MIPSARLPASPRDRLRDRRRGDGSRRHFRRRLQPGGTGATAAKAMMDGGSWSSLWISSPLPVPPPPEWERGLGRMFNLNR